MHQGNRPSGAQKTKVDSLATAREWNSHANTCPSDRWQKSSAFLLPFGHFLIRGTLNRGKLHLCD
eukprot:5880365-Amphidinium_carterae.1